MLRRRGYTVSEVAPAKRPSNVIEEEHFDIVLTDIHMPGMDGIETRKAIRAHELAPAGPARPSWR